MPMPGMRVSVRFKIALKLLQERDQPGLHRLHRVLHQQRHFLHHALPGGRGVKIDHRLHFVSSKGLRVEVAVQRLQLFPGQLGSIIRHIDIYDLINFIYLSSFRYLDHCCSFARI